MELGLSVQRQNAANNFVDSGRRKLITQDINF